MREILWESEVVSFVMLVLDCDIILVPVSWPQHRLMHYPPQCPKYQTNAPILPKNECDDGLFRAHFVGARAGLFPKLRLLLAPEETWRLPILFDCDDGQKNFRRCFRHSMFQENVDFGGPHCLDRTWEEAAVHLMMDQKGGAAETRVVIVRKLLLLWAVVSTAVAADTVAAVDYGVGSVRLGHWKFRASSSDCLPGATKRDNPSFMQLPLWSVLFPSVFLIINMFGRNYGKQNK